MSDMSSLKELARFVGQSSLAAEDPLARRIAVNAIVSRIDPPRRSVSELLAAVMALSARTRRMLLPPVAIDIDVFSPGGSRAVRVTLPRRA